MESGPGTLDYSSLRDALGQLRTSLGYCESPLASQDKGVARQFQAAAIQGFEFTYELAHKMLRRHIAMRSASPAEVENYSFAELIRAGQAARLIKSDWQIWGDYRHARSITSHTYSARSAARVFALIPQFVEDTAYLVEALEQADQK